MRRQHTTETERRDREAVGAVRDPRFNALRNNVVPSKRTCANIWKDGTRLDQIPVREAELMATRVKNTPIDELMDGLARYRHDPLGFVMWAFPWGEPNTSLEDMTGPEDWQTAQLTRIGDRLRAGAAETGDVIQEDVSSGHGIGKSAMVSWMMLWAVSTCADTRGVVTANTESQLRTKTWAELGKWYGLFIARSLFTFTATALHIADDPVREKSWRLDAIPWSKEKSEAFAGLHNQGKRLLVVFDEASAIDDLIWEVTEGALTDANTEIIWLRYGNPTKTSGAFFKRCSQPGKRWSAESGLIEVSDRRSNTYSRVDSRTVSFSNKKQIQTWIIEYGEDSDFVRVRVKGEFPRAGFSNFISAELVFNARRRVVGLTAYQAYPKILSVDPARFGDDFSVITLRQGIKVHYQIALSGFDGVDLGGRIFELVRQEKTISCIVYDAIGNGADLDSTLRRMNGLPTLIPLQWGQPAKDDKAYSNQRAECWGRMREWLETGQIPDNDDLAEELTALDYFYDAKFRIQLQAKKDLKKAGVKSPDRADSLAISFAPDLIERKFTNAKVRPVQRRTVVWSRSA